MPESPAPSPTITDAALARLTPGARRLAEAIGVRSFDTGVPVAGVPVAPSSSILVTVRPNRPGVALEMAAARGFEGDALVAAAQGILAAPEAATVTVGVDESAVAVAMVEQAFSEALSEVSNSLSGVRGFIEKHAGAYPWKVKPIVGATWALSGIWLGGVEAALSGVPFHVVLPERLQRAVEVMREYGKRLARWGSAKGAGEGGTRFLRDVQGWVLVQRSVLSVGTPAAEREMLMAAWLSGDAWVWEPDAAPAAGTASSVAAG